MGQALYRKYRSRSFSEVIGQESITATLANAITSGRISHAYLLAGPHGVGKTSVARILAHEVNKLPYEDESIHLDIIEIDAASNRRIDEIRDIRQKVHIAPTSAKYKVYIIDEVHMLTKEAFNALLKTLEEPPAHCIFILATTEAHKLPETIISRTQRFNFKPIEATQAVAHLKNIARKEKIDIEPAALELLAEHSEGSFRDAIGMLDQLGGSGGHISGDDARQLLGLPPSDSVSKLIELVSIGAFGDILDLLNELKQAGISPELVATGLSKKLRAQIIASGANQQGWTTDLLKKLLDISSAGQPYELLEISLLETAIAISPSIPQRTKSVAKVANSPPAPTLKPPLIKTIETKAPIQKTKANNFSLELWSEVLSEIKKRAASIYTALRLAEPEIDNNILILTFQFSLHKKKVEQARDIKLISDVIEELSGVHIEIKCVEAEKPLGKSANDLTTPERLSTPQPSELTTISNIFGSAEMLE
ncbi:MAG: DNA polymerase III subunit gamma/tau [bacterium]|nr:DNA polymerase III subunit gamma/tau [bacterium]